MTRPARAASPPDVVVVGAGINGLVAAAELGRAGLDVTLVEAADRLGGFIGSGELTAPGYVHDTWSSWHPLFVTGPAYAALGTDLARHGLRYVTPADEVTASVAAGGRVSLAYRDVERTVAGFAEDADRDAYRGMLATVGADLEHLGPLMGSELHARAVAGPTAGLLRRRALPRLARDAASSGRSWLRERFRGPEVDHLWAPWLLHAGLSPDHASGGLTVPLLAATMHAAGLPVVEGGAGRFVDAFAGLLGELGVEVRLGAPVERVVVEGRRAVGVVAGGEEIRARRAVVATLTPDALYGRLLPPDAVPPVVRDQAARYRRGRGAMQIHVALSAPPRWTDERLARTPLVHLSDGSGSTGIACAQAEADLLPATPTVVVGQQHLLDDTRVPPGTAALWLQLQEVPYAPRGDAAGELDTHSGWDEKLTETVTYRVLDLVGRHAPGLRDLVVGVHAITPPDLEAANPNAVGGDPYGGSAELDQNFWWRPVPDAAHHRTPVDGLWQIGASTHPGPGLGGGSGHLVAQALTRRSRRPHGSRS